MHCQKSCRVCVLTKRLCCWDVKQGQLCLHGGRISVASVKGWILGLTLEWAKRRQRALSSSVALHWSFHSISRAVLTVLSEVHLNSLTCWLKRDWPAWRTETSGALNEFAQSDALFFSSSTRDNYSPYVNERYLKSEEREALTDLSIDWLHSPHF